MADPLPAGLTRYNARSWAAAGGTALLALGAIAVFTNVHGLSWPSSPGWLLLLPAYVIAERTEIHFEFRKQTVSWSLNEIPSVIGLFVFGVEAAATTRAVAIVVVLAARYSAPKLAFNVAVAVLELLVAGYAINALQLADVTDPITWLGLIGSLLLAGVLGIGCIAGAIWVTEGAVTGSFWSTLALPQLLLGPLAATIGVVVLLLLEVSPWASILAMLMLGAVVLLYRRYAAAAQDRRSLSEVYAFAQMVQNAGIESDGERVILEAVREKFNAARAALWIPSYLDQAPRSLAVSGDGAAAYPGLGDPHDAIRLETSAGQGPKLLTQGTHASSQESAGLSRRGVTELIGVPLDTEAAEPGYLEVCDRNGSVLQFTPADVELMRSLATHVTAAVRQQQLLDKIRYDAAHDQVTNLPNRFWLIATIDAHLETDPADRRLALLVVEIDGFAQVKETLGHAAGDELLQVVAGALVEHIPSTASVASVGGAQFAVVLPEANVVQAEAEAARLRHTVSSPVQVSGLQLRAAVTLGVAVAPLHGSSSGELLQHADVALLAARSRGLATATYNPAMDHQSLRRLQLGTDLADAISSSQISIAFQPIVGTGSGEIAAVELLSRWTHPRLGPVSPDEFIPLAERLGLITPLTRRVLQTAMQRCQRWLDEGIVVSMAVNLSSVSLTEPGFVDEVAQTLREQGFPAELLTFEITEGSVIGEALALPALKQLHELGVGLSIDDFGTGYSSLSYLRRLPIDEVKIDKSFVLRMSTDPGTNTIARSIIDLAHNLGLRVVAEGVEDEVTRELLSEMNCDFLQGYLISPPLTESNLVSWLSARTAAAPADQDRSQRRLFIRG